MSDVWTDEDIYKLVDCHSDKELRQAFPDKTLENLKRRRREFIKSRDIPDPALNIGRLADLLENAGIDVRDIGRVRSVRLNEWQAAHKDPDTGEAVVTDLQSASIIIEPSWADGPEWPVVDQAKPTKVVPAKVRKKSDGIKTAVILPDPQIGFRRDLQTMELDPFHDEQAMAAAMSIVADLQPDVIVNLGDLIDLPEFSRHMQEPSFAFTTQASIDRAHLWLAEQRASSPNAEIVVLEGNHDRRLEKSIMLNAKAAFGIQRACLPASFPVLSMPYLMRMDDLNVQYLDGYPANIFWINDNVCAIHGHKVRSGGSTANAVIDDERVSVIFGHIHRIELQHRTRRTRDGAKSNFAACPGCLCRLDGAVPGFKASTDIYGRPVAACENWQQGIGVVTYQPGDGPFHLEIVPIHEGGAIFRGEQFYGATPEAA